jgi:hypothetical protein
MAPELNHGLTEKKGFIALAPPLHHCWTEDSLFDDKKNRGSKIYRK